MNLLGALAKVGSLTMVSRILGFLRDTVIARAFGAGMATDAFFVAFKLPNLLRRVFAEGAFAQAFVPILAEYKETRSKEATEAFIRHVVGMLSFVLVIVTALGIGPLRPALPRMWTNSSFLSICCGLRFLISY